MLKETYYNQFKGWGTEIPKEAHKVSVMRCSGSFLAPSWDLLRDSQAGRINWEEYEERFRNEMSSSFEARTLMKDIKKLSKDADVYLVCSCHNNENHCHRFILIDMINKL
ncbi:Uncharacterised protein [uncultured archaeon]|nr:Uncharacterised protein [uncultured archaeon]